MTDTRDAANPQKYWVGYMSNVSIDGNDVINWGNRNAGVIGGWWMLENLRADKMPNGEAIANQIIQSGVATPGYMQATKPEHGYFYNWAAATNKKGGANGLGNVDNPDGSGLANDETDIEPLSRQGICPDGFVLPSNTILRALAPLTHQYIRPTEGGTQVSRTLMAQGEGIDLNTGLSKTPAAGGFSYYYTGLFNTSTQAIVFAGTQASGLWSNSGGAFNTQANFVHNFSYNSPTGGSRGLGWRYDGRTVRCVSAAK